MRVSCCRCGLFCNKVSHKKSIMKIYKIVVVLLLPLLADIVVACCDCLDSMSFNYKNCNLTLKNLDNTGRNPSETISNTIKKTAYGIRLRLEAKEDVCEKSRNYLFLPSAYALSCDCPPELEYLPLDSILALKIITVNDFDTTHAANADVSDYFRIYESYYFSTLTEYLNKDAPIYYNEQERAIQLDFLLMNSPTTGTEHQFKIEIDLSDGRKLVQHTPSVTLI